MKWEEWEPLYLEIVREMGYSVESDMESAIELDGLIADRFLTLEKLKDEIGERGVAVVFGAGPSLRRDVEEFKESGLAEHVAIIAADGASRIFLEKNLRTDLVVTDLDGGDDTLIESSRRCLAMVVHAHGDNIGKVRSLVPRLHGRILGTTQCKSFGRLYNFGGFTDGDRAVFLSDALGFAKIVLAGMDFGDAIGEYSKTGVFFSPERAQLKLKKLTIGKRLLEIYARSSDKELYNATSGGVDIEGFVRTSFKSLAKKI